MSRICNYCQTTPLIRSQRKYCSMECFLQDTREVRNPDLIENYFETIDTCDKAYWLGFLFADGHIKKPKLHWLLKYAGRTRIYFSE